MPISVTVRDLQAGAPARDVVLPEPVATIGRSQACDVVLQDSERHVSRLHATIELRASGHYLLNNSRINPVLVDGVPCELESATALHDGAVVLMHPFELTLHISHEPIDARRTVPEAGADEFDWLGKLQPKPVEGDLFTLDVRPTQAQAAPPDSDIFFRPEREASSLLIPGIENPGGLAPPSLDPLKLLDGQGANTHDAQFGALLETGSGGERPLLVEFGGRDRERESASLSPVHVQAIHAKFTPPTVVPTAALEDAGEPIDWPPDWPFDTPPGGASAEKQAGDPPVPPAPPAVASPDADAIHSFLRGLGMSFQVPTGQEAEFFEKAGEIMKVAVQGLVNLLLARAEVKRELRAEDRTMLAASANNPLKFVGGSEEALRFLFDPSTVQAGGFLPPVEAIEAACEELVAHELGMVAGTRAAVIGAIRRFDPDSFGHGAGHGVFALWRKARRWELYCAHYATLQAEMADNLDGLFQRDFLAAYTEQVRRVARHNLPSEQ